jgi:hypothetical protein
LVAFKVVGVVVSPVGVVEVPLPAVVTSPERLRVLSRVMTQWLIGKLKPLWANGMGAVKKAGQGTPALIGCQAMSRLAAC